MEFGFCPLATEWALNTSSSIGKVQEGLSMDSSKQPLE